MKIHCTQSSKEIKDLVSSKAKYQKVMVIYDETAEESNIEEIYEHIKDICIFNRSRAELIDFNELNNGYRMIIYLINGETYLKLKVLKDDFINIFCPTDNKILPFFLDDECRLDCGDSHLMLNKEQFDLNMISSVCFNVFFNYFQNLVSGNNTKQYLNFLEKEISQHNIFDSISNMENYFFLDVNIIKNQNLSYDDLILLDLMLIDSFLLLLEGVKYNSCALVDVYKSGKENFALIEKCYKLYNNDVFRNLIVLNFNCLNNLCLKTKQKILEFLSFVEVDDLKITKLIESLKQYSKRDSGVVGYLYLYNFFNV